MADTPSQISFDEILALSGGDHQHAGWIAMQLSKGSTLEQAQTLYGDVLSNLETYKRAFDAGDNQAPVIALNFCISVFRFPPPAWLADTWGRAYSAWRYCEAGTLDDAFGVNRKHLNAQRKRILFSGLVWQFVRNRHDAGAKLDDYIFELAAEHVNAIAPDDLKIGKTAANEMYYAMKRMIESRQK